MAVAHSDNFTVRRLLKGFVIVLTIAQPFSCCQFQRKVIWTTERETRLSIQSLHEIVGQLTLFNSLSILQDGDILSCDHVNLSMRCSLTSFPGLLGSKSSCSTSRTSTVASFRRRGTFPNRWRTVSAKPRETTCSRR